MLGNIDAVRDTGDQIRGDMAAHPFHDVAIVGVHNTAQARVLEGHDTRTIAMEAALGAGLMEAHHRERDAKGADVVAEAVAEVVPEPAAAVAPEAPSAPAAATDAPAVAAAAPRAAMVIDRPLRSGQQVYAKGCDLIVLAVVSFGAEVIADGNIHVYAPLRGRALAGAHGDTAARIFTTCLEPQLVSIAGIYRTTEKELSADVRGKPAQIWLDGDSLVIEPLNP